MGAVWTVKGGRQGEREERLLEHGLLGGGWLGLPSLEDVTSKEQLAAVYAKAYPDAGRQRIANYVGQLWSLLNRMQVGDLVVLPLKTTGTVAVGRITGGYKFREDLGWDLQHQRTVEWLATDVPRDAFDQDLLYSFGAFLTFGQVRRDDAERRILAAVERRGTEAPTGTSSTESGVEGEEAPDVRSLAREQVRQFVSRSFAGHELARLVGAILAAQGLTVDVSPPGTDRGVDILGGTGPLGTDSPRVVVQVKTGQAGVEEFRSLRGLVTSRGADQGLLVAWGGYRGTVLIEAESEYFHIRLWNADDLLDALFDVYNRLPDDIRSELALQQVWALVPPAV